MGVALNAKFVCEKILASFCWKLDSNSGHPPQPNAYLCAIKLDVFLKSPTFKKRPSWDSSLATTSQARYTIEQLCFRQQSCSDEILKFRLIVFLGQRKPNALAHSPGWGRQTLLLYQRWSFRMEIAASTFSVRTKYGKESLGSLHKLLHVDQEIC